MKHKWLTDDQPSNEHDLSAGLRDNYQARRRWRTTINTVRMTNRLRSFTSSRSATSPDEDASTEDEDTEYHDTQEDGEAQGGEPNGDGTYGRVLGGGPEARVAENDREDARSEQKRRERRESDAKIHELAMKMSTVNV